MPLAKEDLEVIKLCFMEKHWEGTRICREFPNKHWNVRAVNRAIKRLKDTGSINRKQGSGPPRTANTPENREYIDEHISSQNGNPGSHISGNQIARNLGISRRSVGRITKAKNLKSVKRLDTPTMPLSTKDRRVNRSRDLLRRFPFWRVRKMTFQDEKYFTIEVPSNHQNNRIYIEGRKSDVDPARLYHGSNKQSLKLMVSCCVSWNGVTKPFFVDPQRAKVTGAYYTSHLKKHLIPACKILYPENDFIFVQDGATSHTSNMCKDKLKELCGQRFLKKNEWPPKSPDCNPLDYYFWDALSVKVYENRREPFTCIEELKKKVRAVWKQTINMEHLRKAIQQFRPRLEKVVEENGGPIKQHFG